MTDDELPANRLESLALTAMFFAVALALLLAMPWATRWGQASGGWWTRPALMPGLALAGLTLANLITLGRALTDLRADPPTPEERIVARQNILGWLRPVEFLAYFAIYVWAIGHLGYLLATLTFILGLMLRVRLTSPRWLLTGVLTALALVAIFRVGLGVWMPAPPLYDLAPDALRTALIRWF
ncbi:tripartite tricarboxylate transporter TctB family protein [Rhodobacter ferrooxidans]|uniref:DUF1468 domain-containing protein n=1 Tax=Rhodobacter ferrooxidans TaxID=371731 RepID=C8RWQ2_9RHOB|nr:tripartite tricarboxylate transporter TctB family protein [Rhodobacter sp. SW2]EEW26995.1 conserved hypothetical protein [Rhodobacter sp. SW2]